MSPFYIHAMIIYAVDLVPAFIRACIIGTTPKIISPDVKFVIPIVRVGWDAVSYESKSDTNWAKGDDLLFDNSETDRDARV
jgi:hypothetical protein